MADYQGTPLTRKLGIKAGARVALIGAPDGFPAVLGALPPGVQIGQLSDEPQDVLLYFAKAHATLARNFAALAARLDPAGGLWVIWPKKASGMATDLSEDTVRDVGLSGGLVDNKVCAVDEDWSGLRFVIRVVDRPRRSR